jgi:hypothetical protein
MFEYNNVDELLDELDFMFMVIESYIEKKLWEFKNEGGDDDVKKFIRLELIMLSEKLKDDDYARKFFKKYNITLNDEDDEEFEIKRKIFEYLLNLFAYWFSVIEDLK